MKTIYVCNQKGGIGKTTSVIELGATLSALGKKILLVDADGQCNLTTYLGLNKDENNIVKILRNEKNITDDGMIEHKEYNSDVSLDIIKGSTQLSDADKIFTQSEDVFLLVDALSELGDKYDFCLIDTNPARNIILKMAYAAADYAILPGMADMGSIEGIIEINKDIIKNRNGRIPITTLKVIALILARYENSGSYTQAESLYKEIAAEMQDKPKIFITGKSIHCNDARFAGEPLFVYEKKNKVCEDYLNISKYIVKLAEEEQ